MPFCGSAKLLFGVKMNVKFKDKMDEAREMDKVSLKHKHQSQIKRALLVCDVNLKSAAMMRTGIKGVKTKRRSLSRVTSHGIL